jgi:CHASE3 domain sensor protein
MYRPKSAPAVAGIKAKSSDNIFTFEFPQTYDRVIFNNGGTGDKKQETAELTWEESKTYFVLSGEKDGEGHYKGSWMTPSAIAAVQAVEDKIDAIGTVAYTDASKTLIDAARSAYNALTTDQKGLVTNFATLEAAEKTYADLKAAAEKAAADKAAAKAVDDKIAAIGTVTYTDASKALIDAARSAYDALTADQKALITKLAVLEAAEKTYADLKAAAEKAAADKAAAKAVDDKIAAIGTVTYTDASKALIDAARSAYNALTADQKALVTKLPVLEAAEKTYADLKAAAEKAAADKAAAKAVDDKIDAIGIVEYTDASKALIDAARAAYEALTDDQKALVTKLAVLEAAEQTYEDLKAAATTAIDDLQSSDVSIQKVFRNGKMYILVGEKIFDATGRLVE